MITEKEAYEVEHDESLTSNIVYKELIMLRAIILLGIIHQITFQHDLIANKKFEDKSLVRNPNHVSQILTTLY